VVFWFVEKVLLGTDEVGGQEDVGAEGGEEGVEVWRRGRGELGEAAWVRS